MDLTPVQGESRVVLMATTNYLTPAQYRAAKSRLTRALNLGNPEKILEVVTQTFEDWDDGDYAYPDDWHRWERAKSDAEFDLRFAPW